MKDGETEIVTVAEGSSQGDESKTEMRYYNLSICYDRYYYVPRIFFTAYDENDKEIDQQRLLDDVASQYANKVVSVDVPHYGTGQVMASVHPCKHANVLKESTENIAQNKGVDQVGPHLAILIFIKFFNSIMPNLELDCDFDFEG